MANWITAISTFLMMMATIALAIAGWQAKNSFIREHLYSDATELYEIIIKLISKFQTSILFLFEDNKRKAYGEELQNNLDKMLFLIGRIAPFCSVETKDTLMNLYIEISRFWGMLIQEACPYEELKGYHKELMVKVDLYTKNESLAKILINDLALKGAKNAKYNKCN